MSINLNVHGLKDKLAELENKVKADKKKKDIEAARKNKEMQEEQAKQLKV